MMVQAKFAPGAEAVVEIVRDPATDSYALRLRFDPGVVVVGVPDQPGGATGFAAFLVALAREAGMLATVFDPSVGRHALTKTGDREARTGLAEWFGQSDVTG